MPRLRPAVQPIEGRTPTHPATIQGMVNTMELLLFVLAIVLLVVAAFIPNVGRVSLLCIGLAVFVLAVAWPTLTV